MNKSLAMLVIGLFFGGMTGFITAASYGVTFDGHDHAAHGGEAAEGAVDNSDHLETGHGNHEQVLALTGIAQKPTLSIAVSPDPVSGWNLRVETTNFVFAPEHASLAHIDGEGHAHVYVNGHKIARLYGSWMHIASLPKGDNSIEVSLNSNDHRQLAIGDKPLRAQTTVSVP